MAKEAGLCFQGVFPGSTGSDCGGTVRDTHLLEKGDGRREGGERDAGRRIPF